MKKIVRNNRGFSLAEMILVVAIIVILAGVSFVAGLRYQRNLNQVEKDGIAKELFIAAQNHLSAAESQGYLGADPSAFGTAEEDENGDPTGVYYFIVGTESRGRGGPAADDGESLLSMMLPFASIDETVRQGGSYVIRYQTDPALVLDVFYASPSGRFAHSFGAEEYEKLVERYRGTDESARKSRRFYNETSDNSVIGWYGGTGAARLTLSSELNAPSLSYENAARLRFFVTDGEADSHGLRLVLHGESSGRDAWIDLIGGSLHYTAADGSEVSTYLPSGVVVSDGADGYTVTLDDVTAAGRHFRDLLGAETAGFIPGENLSVYACAYETGVGAAASGFEGPSSNTVFTNSLFGDGSSETDAEIANIRHLENLDTRVSRLDEGDGANALNVAAAHQTADLSWPEFLSEIGGQVYVTGAGNGVLTGTAGTYFPVNWPSSAEQSEALGYDGGGHSVSGVVVRSGSPSGLFGELVGADVRDLELIDFDIACTNGAGAGALVGNLRGGTVSGVLARNTAGDEALRISAVTGSAGGLIGSMSQDPSGGRPLVEQCAAAVYVYSESGSAGGLIGSAMGGAVTGSYAGGHTRNGAYLDLTADGEAGRVNVIAPNGSAGGLVGSSGGVNYTTVYSTASAAGGAAAGGLLGSSGVAGQDIVMNAYAVSRVVGLDAGASLGAAVGALGAGDASLSGLRYYALVNEGLLPVGDMDAVPTGVSALDESLQTYNSFITPYTLGAGTTVASGPAQPYDDALRLEFKGSWSMPSVSQLGYVLSVDAEPTAVGTRLSGKHYGDWPSPEVKVVNTHKLTAGGTEGAGLSAGVDRVSVTYDDAAGLPAGVSLSAAALQSDAADYAEYRSAAALAARLAPEEVTGIELLDLSLVKDGAELQPGAAVDVELELGAALRDGSVRVVHFGETAEPVAARRIGDTLSFRATSFSVYAVVSYDDLAQAIEAAADGDTIQLNDDVVTTNAINVTKSLTIDLDGHTLTLNHSVYCYQDRTVEFVNGTIVSATGSAVTLQAYNSDTTTSVIRLGSELTVGCDLELLAYTNDRIVIDGATVTGDLTVPGGSKAQVLSGTVAGDVAVRNGASLTVSGGTVSGAVQSENGTVTVEGGAVSGAVSISEYGSLNVTGGEVTGAVSGENAAVTVTGGTVDDITMAGNSSLDISGDAVVTGTISAGDGVNVAITGGTFSEPPDPAWVQGEDAVTITLTGTVSVPGRPYDGTNLAELDLTDATVTGIPPEDEGLVSIVAVLAGPDVGEQAVTGLELRVERAGLYILDATEVELTGLRAEIAPRAVTVTADDQGKLTGEADPELTATVEGLIGDDTVVYTLSREPGEGIGTYAITPAGEAFQGNYFVTFVPGTLTITDGRTVFVTVTGHSDTAVYDGDEHSVSGYDISVSDESILTAEDISFSGTAAAARTDAGTTPMGLTAAAFSAALPEGYHAIFYVTDGYVTVEPAPVTLTAGSLIVNYDGETHTVSDYTCSVAGLSFEGVTASVSESEKGIYPVTFTGVTLHETRDTTGNYVVTETVDGELIITVLVTKELTAFSGNLASYTITVNPDAVRLNKGRSLTLRDTFSFDPKKHKDDDPPVSRLTQSIDYSSVTVLNSDTGEPVGAYDYSGYTGTFTLPDETPLIITYTTRALGSAGDELVIVPEDSIASLGVMNGDELEAWGSASVTATKLISPSLSDISGEGGEYTIQIFAYADGHMEQGLGGAVFRLLDYNQNPVTYKKGEKTGQQVTFTTGDNGYVTVRLTEEEDGVSIHKNTVYYLEMITAPIADNGDGTYTYFQKDNTLLNFLITDSPEYSFGDSGIYTYFNGDVVKVRCYAESVGINVTTRFSGNVTLTDEQKNKIIFILEKEDPLSESGWEEVERHSFSEFKWGSLRFNTGANGWLAQDYGVTYRVREENAGIEGVELNTACVVSLQRNGVTTSEEGNDFLVDPDHRAYSFSLTFTNEYYIRKLTFYALDEELGTLLENVVFTAYKAEDDTPVATYTTNAEGTVDIVHTAAYASDTLYYAVQTAAPDGYLLPDAPQRVYFYFSEHNVLVPSGLPAGETAIDLSKSYTTVAISNISEKMHFPVIVVWGLNGMGTWPDTVSRVVVALHQSVDGGMSTAVENMSVALSAGKVFDNTTFVELPRLDELGREITYTLAETVYDTQGHDITEEYAVSQSLSGSGWYVIRNQSSISVKIQAKWYSQAGSLLPSAPAEAAEVSFDLYRTTAEIPNTAPGREELEAFLASAELVSGGLTLSASDDWTRTVPSLQETDSEGHPYYYFALELEDSMPQNHADSYEITAAADPDPRTLTIRNTRTPVTVIIKADGLTKNYGDEDPEWTFSITVQDSGVTVGDVTIHDDGEYEFTVTKDGDAKTIRFTLERDPGEAVGSYALTLSGGASQNGYRVRFQDGSLTIDRANVTVTAGAVKSYGDPDPALAEVSGMRYGEDPSLIQYKFYREPGEDVDDYDIWLSGESIQGNYNVSFVNGVLRINRATVTVTADNLSKGYGEADGELTATVTGLRRGDSPGVITYSITREEGEDAGDYAIIPTGEPIQDNYTVVYEPGIFTIERAPLTVIVSDAEITYGDPAPEWEILLDGLLGADADGTHTTPTISQSGNKYTYSYLLTSDDPDDPNYLSFDLEWIPGESVGEYDITVSGETEQQNYNVSYDSGKLLIDPAMLTVRADDIVKDVQSEDPVLTATVTGWKNSDGSVVPDVTVSGSAYTYSYDLGGAEPLRFTLSRAAGNTEGDYPITAAGSYRQGNYEIDFEPGVFSILSVYNIDVRQVTADRVAPGSDPAYTYRAEVDLTGTGLTSLAGYTKNGDVYQKDFTLGGTEADLETLLIPIGAKLTVTQQANANDVNYETEITLDYDPYTDVEGALRCTIDPVDDYYAITFTHTRICLPVTAMAGVTQSEAGARALTPAGFMGIPEGERVLDQDDIQTLQTAIGYSLPTDKYYGFDHARLVHEDGSAIAGAASVYSVWYDTTAAAGEKWKYRASADGAVLTMPDDAVLRLYYYPKFVCQIDAEKFYTMNEALSYMTANGMDEAEIEMLLADFYMPATDALTIPAGYTVTLKTAVTDYEGADGTSAVISRGPALSGNLFVNNGTLILDDVILDGNSANVQGAEAMVRNSGTLTVNPEAILRNAHGGNGGAISMDDGEATISGTLTGNTAARGGAVYLTGGELELAGGTVSGNAATTGGGAVFMTGGTVTVTGATIGGTSAADANTAANGGAFYLEGGTLQVSGGAVSYNRADTNGGMLYATGGDIEISGGEIIGNAATNGNGGAICYTGPDSVTISGGTIQKNNASIGFGGAVYQSSGTVTVSGTIGGSDINTANTAQNGAAVYVAAGTANFTSGCNIRYNKTTIANGGGVGVEAAARLYFSGNAVIKDNKNKSNGNRNVYLDVDSDEIINVSDVQLESGADIRIYVTDGVRSTRGEVCCSFGTYVATANLTTLKDDRGTYTANGYGNKLYWGKALQFYVRYVPAGFPTASDSGTALKLNDNKSNITFYPRNTENEIYELVTSLYNLYYDKNTVQSGYVFANAYANSYVSFSNYVTSIDWDSVNRKWLFKHNDTTVTDSVASNKFTIFYSDAAYISITNNEDYPLTLDTLTVMGKNAVTDGYGYVVAINSVTQSTLRRITPSDLSLAAGDSIRLLFPGATNQAWTLSGTFLGADENSAITYHLNGGNEMDLTTTETEGGRAFSLNGNTVANKGEIYSILFGESPPICKVANGGVEHPFVTLQGAVEYITASTTVLDTANTAMIEMLMDYQQPKTDILEIPEGYHITLTTADPTPDDPDPDKLYYFGDDPTRATISRSSGDVGSAVKALIQDGTAVLTPGDTGHEPTTSLTVTNIVFDGKALGQGGQGGAINTSNVVVNIDGCDFKGYTTLQGGAIYAKWGQVTVRNSSFTNCKILPASGTDKTGGGGIWTTTKVLTVEDCTFINCISQSAGTAQAQGGAIFHNIRYDGAVVHTKDSQKFPTGFSKGSETTITRCYFRDCTAVGSGGSIESDAWFVYLTDCEIYGGKTTKSGGNGGAINVYTNDSKSIPSTGRVEIKRCVFEDCSATNGGTNGGAIRTLSPILIVEDSVFTNVLSKRVGGAISMTTKGSRIEIARCVFDGCSTTDTKANNAHSGAVYAYAKTVTITDSLFNNCTSAQYGGVYQNASDSNSAVTVTGSSFVNCSSTNSEGGALYITAKALSVSGKFGGKTYTYRDKTGETVTKTYGAEDYTFSTCSAAGSGGAVHHNGSDKNELTNCIFDHCVSQNEGGGAYLAGAKLIASGTTFQACNAVKNGGGLYLSTNNGNELTSCTFTHNWVKDTTGMGGSLFINQNTVTISGDSSFEDSIAAYGGGIYQNGGTLNLNGATVSGCYATEGGGGLYQKGTVNAYGSITGCYAKQGGGIYSAGSLNFNIAGSAMTVTGCHAEGVTVDYANGTASGTGSFSSDNLGGGVYNSAGTFTQSLGVHDSAGIVTQSMVLASVTGCYAYDGGGVYQADGTYYLKGGAITGNVAAHNGGGLYHGGGTFSLSGNAGDNLVANNTAAKGGGLFVADGQKASFDAYSISSTDLSWNYIQDNHATEEGGGIAVGGPDAQLSFKNNLIVRYNTMGDANLACNVYLDQDSNNVIYKNGYISPASYIGVYASDAQDEAHGEPADPFGTYNAESLTGMNRFFNDRRRYLYGTKGSDNRLVWVDFVCRITDASGNLLYKDADCTVPAVFPWLENSLDDSAFKYLNASTPPDLYSLSDTNAPRQKYSGAYQVQMLKQDYQITAQVTLSGSKTVTLTTAPTTADECGFFYEGDQKHPCATIERAANYSSMFDLNVAVMNFVNIILDGGYEPEKGRTFEATDAGGILRIEKASSATIGENATLRNSNSGGSSGGAVYIQNDNGKLTLDGGTIRDCVTGNSGGGVYVKKGSFTITENGGAITGCTAAVQGGGVYLQAGTFTMNGGSITGCFSAKGGGVRVDTTMNMTGGSITGNRVSNGGDGGGISVKDTSSRLHFSGTVNVTGNTMAGLDADHDGKDDACNVQLTPDSNAVINTTGLAPEALIGVYTTGGMFPIHGDTNMPFGTRAGADTPGLYCFLNDVTGLVGGRQSATDLKIYWMGRPVLDIRNTVVSDWSADHGIAFLYTVTLDITPDNTLKEYGFQDGRTATFTLTHGGERTLSLPASMNETAYTVTQTVVTDFTTTVQKDEEAVESSNTHSGTLGENNTGSQATGTTVLRFTNIRVKADLTISKTVDSRDGEDKTKEFSFTLTLDDASINKTYTRVDKSSAVKPITFTDGVATFTLRDGEAITVKELPKNLPFTLTENLSAADHKLFQVRIGKNGGASELADDPTATGAVGNAATVEVYNIKRDIVCKITDRNGNLLYYKDGDELVPAIYFHLEDAFQRVNDGGLRTAADGTASGTLRIEMVVPDCTLDQPVTLNADKTVILTTASKTPTDGKYPYDPGEGNESNSTAVVTRSFSGESMIVSNGTLTVDNIVLDGGSSDGCYVTQDGGIIRAESDRLTITETATLRNSNVVGGHNGGAIWIGADTQLAMRGTIDNCSAQDGGGIYADTNYNSITIGTTGSTGGGTITGCEATGSGGAIYTNSTTYTSGLTINANTSLSGNTAAMNGGAIYTGPVPNSNALKIRGGTIENNTATNGDGGGIYMAGGAGFNMSGGTIQSNAAANGNGGGLYATGVTSINGGSFAENRADNGTGGAIYGAGTSAVTLGGTSASYTGNTARYGGVIGSSGVVTMTGGSMTYNSATAGGSGVYMEAGSFHMSGGSIEYNESPKGAVLTHDGAKLYFSERAVVRYNTYTDHQTKMDVYLDFESTDVINATDFRSTASIGVYVADGPESNTYYSHGIADRIFATYRGSTPGSAGLNAFFNDRDDELFGEQGDIVQGEDGAWYVMWPGKTMRIQVSQFDVQADGVTPVTNPLPIAGAGFTLKNITPNDPKNGLIVWSGTSGENGLVEIEWRRVENEHDNYAVFMQYSTYELRQTGTGNRGVLPAGYWELTVGKDNSVTWVVKTDPDVGEKVNRTLAVKAANGAAGVLGDTFILYNDRAPRIVYDANGGTLNGGSTIKMETVAMPGSEKVVYTIDEPNPVWNTKFLRWATDRVPTETTQYYTKGDTIDFYRHRNKDDVILYAQWVPIVCKITDYDDNLLYVNGEPAIYATLEEAFDDYNTKSFTLANGRTTRSPRKLKMLKGSYELTAPLTLERSKTMTLTTASVHDTDGYPANSGVTTCVITRAFDKAESMITNKFNLTLLNITLDGAKETYQASPEKIADQGGIVQVTGDYARLAVGDGATLRNGVSTQGGAIYAEPTGAVQVVTVVGGTFAGNMADEGAGIYLSEDSTLYLSGNPEFSNNCTEADAHQDLYIAGYAGPDDDTSAKSLVVNGNITSAGSIYVWAAESPHYKTLQQFARYTSGVTDTATLSKLLNPRDASVTGADDGEILRGTTRSGDTINVFWSGVASLPVKFQKIDGFGHALENAVFSLYTDPDCQTALEISGTAMTGTSNSAGVVSFRDKIPIGVYYMQETTVPDGCTNSNTYIVLVGDKALAKTELDPTAAGYLTDIGTDMIAGQTSQYKAAFRDAESDYDKYAVFLIDSTTRRAVTTPDIARYGILNISTSERETILKKISNTYSPLGGAVFEILRYDHTPVSGTDINGAVTTLFTSGANGAFFLDMLPYGTYYLHETTIPSGYQETTAGDDGNWFILTVSADGVGWKQTNGPEAGTIANKVRPENEKPE